MRLIALLGLLPLAHATFPMAAWPECGTPDRPDLCPADLSEDWALLGHVPAAWQATVRPDELAIGSGIGADLAWRTTPGRTDVTLAVLDSGILWDEERLVHKIRLNAAELPLPQDAAGAEAADYDANGDGVLNIDDYAADPRLDPTLGVDAADALLDPSDLIAAFSDGSDADGNGYIDDIAGWDFFWNDNDPYDDTRYDHGTYEANEAAAGGDDEWGGIGPCPNCMVLPVRVGDSFVADGASFGVAVLYAVDAGADVIQEALGTVSAPSLAADAISYAWDQGVLVVASAADETAYHPNAPGSGERTLYVHAITTDEDDPTESSSFLAYSNCTNHGVRLDLSAPSGGCSSGATAITSGVAGLAISAARDVGLTLSAAELFQLLTTTAVDIDVPESQEPGSLFYPSKPGWDRYFGYGRLQANAVVLAVRAGEIPPTAEISSPAWYGVVDPVLQPTLEIHGAIAAPRSAVASWSLLVGIGDQPDDSELIEVASGSSAQEGLLATLDLSALPGFDPAAPMSDWALGQDQVDREDAVMAKVISLRLRVTDTEGRTGLARKAFYAQRDDDWLPGFPLTVGPSLEASPNLADLDDDGVLDIVFADADGYLHAIHGDGSALPGFPVQLGLLEEFNPEHAANHLASPGYAAVGGPRAPSLVSSPAVGDLDGDGRMEIVIGTLRGELHVIGADGSAVPGFPFVMTPPASTDPENLHDEGFFGAPALGDLGGDGTLEIIIGGMDQLVYAFAADGSAVPGWPVRAVFPGYEGSGSRIIGSPALGDLDGDGILDVVIGTAETLSATTGPLYALSGLGDEDPDGVHLPGWPIRLFGAYTQALPYVGEGIPGSPALADVDGDGTLEVTAHTLAGDLMVFRADGTELFKAGTAADVFGEGTNVNDASVLPLINSSSFGDLDNDGLPDLVSGGIGAGYAVGLLYDGRRSPFDHGIGAWSGVDGTPLPGWPRVMEDLQFFMNPAIADLNGDGDAEVIAGSAGFVLHAWDQDGLQPEGWPKNTGQWILASPAVGDVDGDGFLDVVVATRQGSLFAWSTAAPVGSKVEWAGFGHDPAHTRNYETPLPALYGLDKGDGPAVGEEEGKEGCGCSTGNSGVSYLGLGLVALLLRRRRS